MLLFLDVFEGQFLYNALRVVALNPLLPVHSHANFQHTSLHTFLGGGRHRCVNVLESVLGPLTRRHDTVAAVEKLFGLHLSCEQLEVLTGLADHVSIVNGVVGSGKTMLMIAIVAMFTLHPRDDVAVFLAVPTRRKAQGLYEAMADTGMDMTLVATHLGISDPDVFSGDPDYLAAYLDDIGHYDHDILAALDTAILNCGHAMSDGVRSAPPVPLPRDLVKYQHLLAMRHEYLDLLLYSRTADTILSPRPRVFLSPISFLQKLQDPGASGSLPRHLKALKHNLLLVDDFHQCSMQGLMTALAPFECVVLAGDKTRAPPADWLARPCVLPEPRQIPKSLASDWLSSVGDLTQFNLMRTYHVRENVVDCLQAMSPNLEMTSATDRDTVVFPFIFPRLSDSAAANESAELVNDHTVFVHAAVTLALELLWGDFDEPVLCLAFFPELLKNFRSWLSIHLDTVMSMVANWTTAEHDKDYHKFAPLESAGRIAFRTVDEADDVMRVAILLALRHHTTDHCWAGPVLLNRGYRTVALTRATRRLYVFAEDLRRWVFAPRAGGSQDQRHHQGAQLTTATVGQRRRHQQRPRRRAIVGPGGRHSV